MTLQDLIEKEKEALEELVQWESPEHEAEVKNLLTQAMTKSYEAALEEALDFISNWKTGSDEGSQEVDRLYLALKLHLATLKPSLPDSK